MDKKQKLENIRKITKQVIHFEEQRVSDKLSHFLFGRGKNETYRGIYNGMEAIINIKDSSMICWISFVLEMQTDFVSRWRRIFSPGFLPTKYKNIFIVPKGYIMFLGEIKQIPIEVIGLEDMRRFFDKLYLLSKKIEVNEKSNVFPTFRQFTKMQLEELDWWGKV